MAALESDLFSPPQAPSAKTQTAASATAGRIARGAIVNSSMLIVISRPLGALKGARHRC
jgi:hypothetical protein